VIEKSTRLGDMIEIAEKLSSTSKFVRVDLYRVGEAIRFGELTNYPGGATEQFRPRSMDLTVGAMWAD
jgi:hypothetical protein